MKLQLVNFKPVVRRPVETAGVLRNNVAGYDNLRDKFFRIRRALDS